MLDILVTPALGAKSTPATLLLAHGAGAPMDSAILEAIAGAVAARGVTVVRFEFTYMSARRTGGKRRPPPKAETLCDEYHAAVKTCDATGPLLIGGKSMGGRVASLIADDLFAQRRIAGLVCLGYPFHPPKKPDSLRTAHLADLRCPALIVQGAADPLGSRAEVEGYRLSPRIGVTWIAGGDHDLAPRARYGLTKAQAHAQALEQAAEAVASFSTSL
jgi:uncharacterized protein